MWNLNGNTLTGESTASANCPLLSPHTDGVTTVYADGSVHFLSDQLPLTVLYHLADINDGNIDAPGTQ